MNCNKIIYIFFGVVAILGWNAFAIQRDLKLYSAYSKLTLEQKSCSQQLKWHPDYNLK
jgi:hypothetical protein